MTTIRKLIFITLLMQLAACASTSVNTPIEDKRPQAHERQVEPTQQVVVPQDSVIESQPLPRRERLILIEPSQTAPQTDSRPVSPNPGDPFGRNRPSNPTRTDSPILTKLLRQADEAAAVEEWSRAENYLERALRIDSKNPVLWQRLSQTKMSQDRPHQAIQFARKSITLSGSNNNIAAKSWGIISRANTRLNRPNRAKAAQQRQNQLKL